MCFICVLEREIIFALLTSEQNLQSAHIFSHTCHQIAVYILCVQHSISSQTGIKNFFN